MDKKGFERIFRIFYPNGKVEKFCSLAFAVFDIDQSGTIDFNEFLIAISTLCNDDLEKKLKLIFKIYDTDHNGQINKKEIKQVLESMNELVNSNSTTSAKSNEIKDVVNFIFQRFNKKNIKSISEEEFLTGCLTDSNLLKILIPNAWNNSILLSYLASYYSFPKLFMMVNILN